MEIFRQLKKLDDDFNITDAGNDQSMCPNNFRKNQRNKITIFSSKHNGIIKIANYQEMKLKLTNTQLNKLKSAAKNMTGQILRLTKKNFEDEELPHELFLTRQTNKITNTFANHMSTDIKLTWSRH